MGRLQRASLTVAVLCVLAGLLSTSGAQAGTCDDPFIQQCLVPLARYVQGIPLGDGFASGPLQQAVDSASVVVDEELAPAIHQRNYSRWSYAIVPFALLVFLVVTYGARKLLRDKFDLEFVPQWKPLKTVVLGVAVVVWLLVLGFHVDRYALLKQEYADLASGLETYLTLPSPPILENQPGDRPCETSYPEKGSPQYDACERQRVGHPLFRNARILETGFGRRIVGNSRHLIGVGCPSSVPIPDWWGNADSFDMRAAESCLLAGTEPQPVQVRHVAVLPRDALQQWQKGQAHLPLDALWSAARGDAQKRFGEQVTNLRAWTTSARSVRRDQVETAVVWRSAIWVALAGAILAGLTWGFIWARGRELAVGNTAPAQQRWVLAIERVHLLLLGIILLLSAFGLFRAYYG